MPLLHRFTVGSCATVDLTTNEKSRIIFYIKSAKCGIIENKMKWSKTSLVLPSFAKANLLGTFTSLFITFANMKFLYFVNCLVILLDIYFLLV